MTSLTESSTDTAQDTQNAATAVSENLIEHPRGAEPGKPGRRDAFYFEQKNRLPDAADGKGRGGARYGRTGIIHTPHGDIHTPAFVPVATQAAMKAVLPETMKDLGAQCLLSNAFHLYERPGEQVLDEAGGLAKFMNWNGPTFTDSGGFQVLSLGAGFKKTLAMDVTGMKSDDVIAEGKERLAFVDEDGVTFKSPLNGSLHRFSAEISMGIQHKIGADIMFAFDELTTLMNTRGYQERSVERTYRWAQRCVAEHKRLTEERVGKPYQALYGVVQGANYEDLRRHAAEQIASLDFDGVGIGGAIEKRIIGDTCAGFAMRCRKADRATCSASLQSTIFSHASRMVETRSIASHRRVAAEMARFSRAADVTTSSARNSSMILAHLKRAAIATHARIIRALTWIMRCVPANSTVSHWRRSTTSISS